MAELAAGATLVELPRKACMMVGERDSCPFPDFVTPALWDELKGDEYQGIVRLALCLLHEKSKGASSGCVHAPYHYIQPRGLGRSQTPAVSGFTSKDSCSLVDRPTRAVA